MIVIFGLVCNNKVLFVLCDNVELVIFVNVSDGCFNLLICISIWWLFVVLLFWFKKMKNGFLDKIGML